MARVACPSSSPTRSRISCAALLVNVIARISPGARAARVDQPRDPVGEHPRLARARAGEHEQRPAGMLDGLPLGLVEPLEEALEALGGGGIGHQWVFS